MPLANSAKFDSEKKKRKSKSKDKLEKSAEFVDEDALVMDGEGSSSGYVPPDGMVPYSEYIDSPEFDYDGLKDNDELELWVIKAPADIKLKHLQNLRLSQPSSSYSSHIGTLSQKSTTYDIWSVKESPSHGTQNNIAGGDDLRSLTCLVPRKKKEGLITAPKPIEHHIVITAHTTLPTPPISSPEAPESTRLKDAERYRHPAHLLKHRFIPIGTKLNTKLAETTTPEAPAGVTATEMDIDKKDDGIAVQGPAKSSKSTREEEKTRKRKEVDGSGTSKKQKKAKSES